MQEKPKGYLQFDDSKTVLQLFVMQNEEIGYELATEIDYGSKKDPIIRLLDIISTNIVDIENLKEIITSDKFFLKFD